MSSASDRTELVVARNHVQLAQGLGHHSIPEDTSFPAEMTTQQARAYVRKFSRKELHNSLSSLVMLRDFAKRDSVQREAASQLVQYACEADDSRDAQPGDTLKELGVSTEDLSEFLRMKREASRVK